MAKKKIENENLESSKDTYLLNKKSLQKDFGDVFLDASEIISKERAIFSLSPKLDIAMSGGIPSGCWGIISGASKLGKSTMALSICAQAQKIGRKCYYADIESRLEKKNLEGIPGLDLSPERLQIIKSTKGNILSAEDHLNIADKILKTEDKIVYVIDSSSAMCTRKEYEGEMAAVGRNEGPKLLAQFTRKLASIVPVQDSLVIIIQHLIANTSGYGSPWLEDGGNKIVYQSDFKIRGVSFKKWEDGEKQIGQVNNWHVLFSALGQPGGKVESYLRFGEGIDRVMELIELACDVGLITKGGAWFNLDFLDTPEKLQGQANVREFLIKNPNQLEKLEKQIKEIYLEV
jgi:recombination protein RecA